MRIEWCKTAGRDNNVNKRDHSCAHCYPEPSPGLGSSADKENGVILFLLSERSRAAETCTASINARPAVGAATLRWVPARGHGLGPGNRQALSLIGTSTPYVANDTDASVNQRGNPILCFVQLHAAWHTQLSIVKSCRRNFRTVCLKSETLFGVNCFM